MTYFQVSFSASDMNVQSSLGDGKSRAKVRRDGCIPQTTHASISPKAIAKAPSIAIDRHEIKTCRRASALLIRWYRHQGRQFPWRANGCGTYRRITTEVLLQRTTATAAARLYVPFFRRFPSWHTLSKASERELQTMLRPIGLWRRRANALSALAKAAVKLRGNWPRNRKVLEDVPAVGQYVASSILLFCFGQREPLLDSNMARVVERVFRPREKADLRRDKWLWSVSCELLRHGSPIEVNWAILDIGAIYCRPRAPRCTDCPLESICNLAKSERNTRIRS